jgi:DHA1 family tetracycline resistance protein-like MFS transporter
MIGLAPEGWMMFWIIPVAALWGLAGPANQSLMSQRVGGSEQGLLQGALASLTGIAGMIGPGLFTVAFANFIGPRADWHLPGAPFLTASLLVVASIIVALVAIREPDPAPI